MTIGAEPLGERFAASPRHAQPIAARAEVEIEFGGVGAVGASG